MRPAAGKSNYDQSGSSKLGEDAWPNIIIVQFTQISRSDAGRCPLWVKSRHRRTSNQCPLYPQKRTSMSTIAMSALCQKRTFRFYSITSSAVASSDCEKVRPSAFAAVKFSTSCNFVGRCTGSSAGLAPLRIWRGIRHEPAESPSPRHCAKPRGFLCVPPPDGGKSCRAVFRHQIGIAEAIPSHFWIEDCAVGYTQASCRHGSDMQLVSSTA